MVPDDSERRRKMTRRDFLGLGRHIGSGALQRSGLLAAWMGQLVPAPAPVESVDVGTPADLAALPPGTVLIPSAGAGQFYLVRTAQGLLALSRRCPRQGCAVLWRASLPALPSDRARGWEDGRFVCLTHGAPFDRYGEIAADGEGAPGRMVRLPVVARQGRLVVYPQPAEASDPAWPDIVLPPISL